MKQLYLLLLLKIPLALLCESLEVALPTRISKTPIYLTQIHSDVSSFDEQRQIIESDLNNNGFSFVLQPKKIEETIQWPDVRQGFNKSVWKKEQIPFVIALQVFDNRLQTVVFDVAQGTSKKYPEIDILDRKEIHRLTDRIQKDLFGVAGIASTHLLYSLRKKVGDQWNSEIWVCDADGSNHRKLIGDQGYCMTPNFFPKSEEFYYVTFQEGQSKIYRSSLNHRSGEVMIHLSGSQALPAINRRGDQIAFISDTAGRPDLFIQNLDAKGRPIGKARQLFTCARATQASPTYRPDGKQIAFVSDKDGVPRVYLLDILDPKDSKKATPQLITKANRENTSPSWSPDGKKIAYSAKVDGVRQIWMIDLESQTELPITTGPMNKENPSWAPDSLHLIYNTENEEICDLYRVHIWHKEPKRISQGRFAAFSQK